MATPAPDKSQILGRILKIEVPVIAVIGEKRMKMGEIVALKPGMVVELGKPADDPLALLVNDRRLGLGRAVRVGEHYGVEITEFKGPGDTIRGLAPGAPTP